VACSQVIARGVCGRQRRATNAVGSGCCGTRSGDLRVAVSARLGATCFCLREFGWRWNGSQSQAKNTVGSGCCWARSGDLGWRSQCWLGNPLRGAFDHRWRGKSEPSQEHCGVRVLRGSFGRSAGWWCQRALGELGSWSVWLLLEGKLALS
jgi:hypothetical protein